MIRSRRAAGALLAAALLMAGAGCATRAPLIETPGHAELSQTPFYPQRQFQCGPASLAMVLGASGVAATPESLEPKVYLPARHGSLQVEMLAAPRGLDRISYTLDGELSAITAELDAGRPVLVLHNYGLPFWPRWHYAVVIGYDSARDEVVMRSGVTERQVWSSRQFMRAWDNGGRWAMVLLRPGELPAEPSTDRYLEAAAAFEKSASVKAAHAVFDAAVRAWPQEPVAWIGRGTAQYRARNFKAAASDYAAALRLDGSMVGARNNLAMALLEQGCVRMAQEEIDKVDPGALPTTLRNEIEDTQRQIREHKAGGAGTCDTRIKTR